MANNDNSADQILVKKASETRKLSMDFTNWVGRTVTLNTPTITSKLIGDGGESDLTFTDTTVSGKLIVFKCSGGVKNNSYTISVNVLTSDGQILEGDGSLRILDE